MTKSLAVIIEDTRLEMKIAVNQVIQKSNLPAYLIDGILTDILSDIRNQKNAELVQDFAEMQKSDKSEEGKEQTEDGEH